MSTRIINSSVAIIVVTLFIATSALAQQAVNIATTTVSFDDGTMTIVGDNFDIGPNPTKVTLGGINLPIISNNGNTIVASLPENLPPGQYQLLVMSGPGKRKMDTQTVVIGEQGPQGDMGEDGDDGADGEDGERGPQGPAGPQGPQGAQGETGPEGPKGDQGDKGDKGDKGDQGDQGVGVGINSADTMNCDGLAGKAGIRVTPFFDANNNGTQDTGEANISGAAFDICEGPPGPIGDRGPVGPPGPSAAETCPCFNEFSIANGFNVTDAISDPTSVICDIDLSLVEIKFSPPPGTFEAIYARANFNTVTDLYNCYFDPFLAALQPLDQQDQIPPAKENFVLSEDQFNACANIVVNWLADIGASGCSN